MAKHMMADIGWRDARLDTTALGMTGQTGSWMIAGPGASSGRRRPGRFSSRTPGEAGSADGVPTGPAASMIDWNDLLPRQVIAIGGGFLAAVSIVGMIVDGSPEFMPFALFGLAAAVGGFVAELAARLREAIDNLLGSLPGDAPLRPMLGWRTHAAGCQPCTEMSREPWREPAGSDREPDPGIPLQGVVVREPPRRLWNPRAAAVFSAVPGLGHVYKGQGLVGLGWLAVVTAGYSAFVLPGIILHGMCVLDSLAGTPWSNGRVAVVRP